MKRQIGILDCMPLLAALLAGCVSTPPLRQWAGPRARAAVAQTAWISPDQPGARVSTSHYTIYTTIPDPEYRAQIAQVLEGAYSIYRDIAPARPLVSQPMLCYVFADRGQWAEFTRRKVGAEAAIYLQVNRGGYTYSDWFAAYDLGPSSTYSVAAHEGWHQYVARHFHARLPPFLEEGIAAMFEYVQMEDSFPRWNLSINPHRLVSLRNALENGELWPLRKLIEMHAGDVVDEPSAKVEAFYAQSWAFARFLWESEKGKYRPMLQQLLKDTADGTIDDPHGTLMTSSDHWLPSSTAPKLEKYLNRDLASIESSYLAFIREIIAREIGNSADSMR